MDLVDKNIDRHNNRPPNPNHNAALRFVLLIGVLSFFADFTYEGARSVYGPFLASLAASATVVSIVAGFGELVGYGFRLVSGRWADRTGNFWPIAIFGYFVQLLAVPALALAHNWPTAAVLIILERFGRATRNPPRDAMLSHAGSEIGFGWAFGVHEALDQFGALFGPLLVAAILAWRGSYRLAFAALLIPMTICLSMVLIARHIYPRPHDLEVQAGNVKTKGLPGTFWTYLAGAALVATGFADFPLIAYHFTRASTVPKDIVPVAYAIAMGVSGTGSLVFGRWFDRFGVVILIPLTLIASAFAPLVFLGGFWPALIGAAVWGLGMGVHESIIPAVVAPMVSSDRRASAYGLFTAGYGIFWFIGSAIMGVLYDRSVSGTVIFCVATQLAAIPLFLAVRRRTIPG
ncbi:MAG TPA: MFS transporter [Alloacidobacterium sp.]|nr:MFS transporter [Alloacidobacterium sp.]